MSETSTSSNSSQSSSSSSPVQTIENDIINQISATASGMAGQLYNWAQGVFAQTSAITNEAVGNFFQASQKMMGLSNNMIDQYNTLFAPENAELVADANSYDSPARVSADMGMAGATAAQAGAAAEANSTAQLQQFGIDPSSGRYASLLNADNVQNAANVAGAENTQRVADTQMGQTLRAEAVQTGAQLPSSIANVTNTGLAANTGAENAELGNANTGANLMNVPDAYLNTAMQVKMPFNAQRSQSTSLGGGQSNKSSPSKADPSGGAGGAPGGGAGTPAWGMNNPAYGGPSSSMGVPGGDPYSLGSMYDWQKSMPTDGSTPWGNSSGLDGYSADPNQGADLGLGNGSTAGNATQEFSNPGGNSGINEFGNNQTNFLSDQGSTMFGSDNGLGNNVTSGGFGGTSDFGAPTTQFGEATSTPTSEFQNPTMPEGWQDPTVQTTWDQPPPSPDYSPSGDSGNQGNQGGDQSSSDNSGFGDDSGGDFARGGAVPARMRRPPTSRMPNMMAQGGQVPQQASPSGGRQVDDVPARGPGNSQMHLNANEFVIPRDVALWKGQEFFQNLINQARQKNAMAAAKPTVGKGPQRQNPPMGVH